MRKHFAVLLDNGPLSVTYIVVEAKNDWDAREVAYSQVHDNRICGAYRTVNSIAKSLKETKIPPPLYSEDLMTPSEVRSTKIVGFLPRSKRKRSIRRKS